MSNRYYTFASHQHTKETSTSYTIVYDTITKDSICVCTQTNGIEYFAKVMKIQMEEYNGNLFATKLEGHKNILAGQRIRNRWFVPETLISNFEVEYILNQVLYEKSNIGLLFQACKFEKEVQAPAEHESCGEVAPQCMNVSLPYWEMMFQTKLKQLGIEI
jgi:hypothetical protein